MGAEHGHLQSAFTSTLPPAATRSDQLSSSHLNVDNSKSLGPFFASVSVYPASEVDAPRAVPEVDFDTSSSVVPSQPPLQHRPSTLARTSAPAPRKSKYSSLDWEQHRETINQLWMKDDRSLEETMEIMAIEHGFHAS